MSYGDDEFHRIEVRDLRNEVRRLEAKLTAARQWVEAREAEWRAKGAEIDTFHATMGTGYHACADDLAKLKAML